MSRLPITTRVVNLEDGQPRVNEALLRLDRAITSARQDGIALVKLIHGYGSSGVGGRIKEEVASALARHKRSSLIRDFIPGEDFRISNQPTWDLLKKCPELKQDRDLSKNNRGITMVII
jgi:Smr domain